MKILSIEMARVGAIVRLDEVFPLNGIFPPSIAQAVAERYSFVYQPNWSAPLSELQEKGGMEFRVGKFQGMDGKEAVIQDLIVLAFGVVANTYSTEVSGELLIDLFRWADEKYETRFTSADVRFFFLSHLMVQFDARVNTLISRFESVSTAISKAIKITYGKEYPVELLNVGLDFDRTLAVEEMRQLSSFAIERQTGKPYSANCFFCQAPLSTNDHIALLEQIEHELAS